MQRRQALAIVRDVEINRRSSAHLSGLQLCTLPDPLFGHGPASTLRCLNVADNQMTELPAALAHLSLLEELHVNRNLLETLPDALCALSQLRILVASTNRFRELPACVLSLPRIEVSVPRLVPPLDNVPTAPLPSVRCSISPETASRRWTREWRVCLR